MRIEQLIHLIGVVKYKSLTKASQKLFITPQALHISLRRMEEELNCSILQKEHDGFVLTEEGKIFYQSAAKILDGFYSAVQELEYIRYNRKKDLEGVLYIYANMVFKRKFLQNVVKIFQNKYPRVQLLFFESDTVTTYMKFNEAEQSDIAKIGFLQVPTINNKINKNWTDTNNYQFTPLFNAEFYACANPKMNFANKESIKKLLEYPVTLYAANEKSIISTKKDFANPLILLLSEQGEIKIHSAVNSMEIWAHTIENNICIGFINNFLADNNEEVIKNLQLIQIKEPLKTTMGFISPKKNNKLIDAFIKETKFYISCSQFNY